MELMHTDLPEPVVPAMSRWGILAILPTTGAPVISLPTAKDTRDLALSKASEPRTSRMWTTVTALLGTSMPMATLSGMGAMRTDTAPSDSAMSSDRAVIRLNLTPRSMVSSNRVTDGPRTMPMIWASMPKDSSVSIRRWLFSVSSACTLPLAPPLGWSSRSMGGYS